MLYMTCVSFCMHFVSIFMLSALSTIATDTEVNISEIFSLLEAEAHAEKEFQVC